MKLRVLAILLIVSLFNPVVTRAAELRFGSSQVVLESGKSATVDLELSPLGSAVIGVDVSLVYDPAVLEVKQIHNGSAFDSLLGTHIDNSAGTAKFALANTFGVYQRNPGRIASIEVVGKSPSEVTDLTLDFSFGRTQDTNVVIDRGQDVLTSVTGVQFRITQGTTGESSGSSPTASAEIVSPLPAVDESPGFVAGVVRDRVISPLAEEPVLEISAPQVLGKKTTPVAQVVPPDPPGNWTTYGLWILGSLTIFFVMIRLAKRKLVRKEPQPHYI